MKQEFVTLPREVVTQALDALEGCRVEYDYHGNPVDASDQDVINARTVLRAALEQPQIQSGGIPPGWRLVPVEPTQAQLNAWQRHFGLIEGAYVAMLNAAPQPQVEQEICCKIWSVNRIDDLGKIVDSSGRLIATVYGLQAEKIVACHNSYTNPQPKREPLTDDDVERLWYQNRGGLWYQNQGISLRFARAIEAAHNIK